MNLYTKFIAVLAATVALSISSPVSVAAQDERSLEDVKTTAEYGEGARKHAAEFELGYRYYSGTKGARQSYSDAIKWWTRSAESGEVAAMYNLYLCYTAESSVKNVSKGVEWLIRAADHYYETASLPLAKMYYFGNNVPQSYTKAARYFKDAAFHNSAEAMYYYAWMNAYGQGVKQNAAMAEFWGLRAVDKGFNDAYYLLGAIYAEGLGVEKSFYEAKKYLQRGIDAGSNPCIEKYGALYEDPEFEQYDLEEAVKHYQIAANKGSNTAIRRIVLVYANEKSEMYNLNKTIYWLKKAFEKGERNTGRFLPAYLAKDAQYEEAAKYYRILGNEGDASALNSLAYLYVSGNLGTVDYDKALGVIDEAIKLAPNEYAYQDSKGEILLKKGDVKAARKIWKSINSQNPTFYEEWIAKHGDTELNKYMVANP